MTTGWFNGYDRRDDLDADTRCDCGDDDPFDNNWCERETAEAEAAYQRDIDDAERAALTPDQHALYNEAISCGASHNDAMEAALTNGYSS